MNDAYKARRAAKHKTQAILQTTVGDIDLGVIDLPPKAPSLAWLGGKTFKQGNGGRKGMSGHLTERTLANIENLNPYRGEDGKWYWMDWAGTPCEIGYVTRDQAEIALNDYVVWYKKEVTSEPMPVSIGGVPEVGLVEGNDVATQDESENRS